MTERLVRGNIKVKMNLGEKLEYILSGISPSLPARREFLLQLASIQTNPGIKRRILNRAWEVSNKIAEKI